MIDINSIKSWDLWCKHFQNIDLFKTLIEEISNLNGLDIKPIFNTYPGTNGVFSMGSYIFKIFVPEEIVSWSSEYWIELKRGEELKTLNISTPKIVAHGVVERDFKWYYIVYERAEGVLVKDIFNSLTTIEKRNIVDQLVEFIQKFQSVEVETDKRFHTYDSSIDRYCFLDSNGKSDLKRYLNSINLEDIVAVHGDLTADNIIYNEGKITIIDFGDSREAPTFYEYSPIIFDLLDCDSEVISYFFERIGIEPNCHLIINSILIHDFGGDIIKELLREQIDKMITFPYLLEILKDKIESIFIKDLIL